MESTKQELFRIMCQRFDYALQMMNLQDYLNRTHNRIMEETRTVMLIHNGYVKRKNYLPKRIGIPVVK